MLVTLSSPPTLASQRRVDRQFKLKAIMKIMRRYAPDEYPDSGLIHELQREA